MLQVKSAKHYYKELSIKYGISQKSVRIIVVYFFRNFVTSYMKGQEITISRFGKFTFDKKKYVKFVIKKNK